MVGRDVWGWEVKRKRRGEKKQTAGLEQGRKIRTYFCFKCVSVHIWSLFWPIYQESPRWPLTRLLRLTWFWLSHSEFNSTLCPRSSRVTSREQQINPMCQTWHDTMFSQALLFKYSHPFHLHAFDVKPSLFLWVILNSTSLQSLWCVTNFLHFNLPHLHLLKSHPPHSNHFGPIPLSLFRLWALLPFCWAGPLCLIFPLTISLSAQILSLCLSLRLKTFQFSCHKLCSPAQLSKQGGCPFHSTSHATKGDRREEGFNARVWTQAIISNYCFSFQFPCPDGGPTRRTCNNPLQSSRISGPRSTGLVLGLCGFHLNVS